MSMERADAIKHFAARKYAELTISEAYEAAPAAARNGLHLADVQWIKRFGSVPAHDAARRLAIRSRANPDGLPTGPGRPSEGKSERMELRMTPEQKAKVSERGGSAWVLALIDEHDDATRDPDVVVDAMVDDVRCKALQDAARWVDEEMGHAIHGGWSVEAVQALMATRDMLRAHADMHATTVELKA